MNKNRGRIGGLMLLLLAFAGSNTLGQTVSSFSQLQPYLSSNNVNLVMTPGTYRIKPADVTSGLFTNATLLSFTGTNSVFNFTGVTFEFETEVFRSFGNIQVIEVAVWGTNVVLSNLTMTDIGSAVPQRTALGVLVDGQDNRIEGFNMTIRGSYPYGYGDIFGKGSGYVIKHFKHSAILVRGDRNHVKNCKIFHRAYGHGIFCQGSVDAVIEGCYLEGETRTTDEVLAEAGTGSAADNVGFMTVWGFPLRPGGRFSLQEDGIRAYNTGAGPDGVERNTRNMQVIDCTVNKMRSGVTIGFCDNTKIITNCVSVGAENGFWPGGGDIINCAGDAENGPLLQYHYSTDGSSDADLTVLNHEATNPTNFNKYLAYIAGNNHRIFLRHSAASVNPNLKITLGGPRDWFRWPTNDTGLTSSSVTLSNLSIYPVELSPLSSGTSGRSWGPVTNLGTGNNLLPITVSTCGGFAVLQTIQAEAFCAQSGIAVTNSPGGVTNVGSIHDGDWLRFDNLFLGSGPNRFEARVASGTNGGSIELRLGGTNGQLIGTCAVPTNQTPNAWITNTITLAEPRGKQNLFLVFKGGAGTLMNLDSFRFYVIVPGSESLVPDAGMLVGHWKFNESSGAVAADSSGHGYHGTNFNGSWVAGINGGALSFNGSSSTVALPAAAFTNIDSQVTVAMWVYGDPLQPLADSAFYAVSNTTRVLNIHLPYSDTNVYWDAGYVNSSSGRIKKLAADAEFKGGWNHWAFTKDATSGMMKIYHNGTNWQSGTGHTKGMTGITAARIGSQITGAYYRGAIDDVQLYNLALSDQEVKNLYYDYAIFRVNGLTAQAASATQIDLQWNAVAGATGYNVKRSLTTDGPYSLVAGGIATTNYANLGLTAGTPYYYVASAVFGSSEGGESAEASAVPSAPINPADVVLSSVGVSSDGFGGQNMTMSVLNSGLGHNYRVKATASLTAPVWEDATELMPGNGGELLILIPINPTEPQRFYRLEATRQ